MKLPKMYGVAIRETLKPLDSLPILFEHKTARLLSAELNKIVGKRGFFIPVEIKVRFNKEKR
jgi:hypothetical protein